jgi:Flp pilus assembly protein TadB
VTGLLAAAAGAAVVGGLLLAVTGAIRTTASTRTPSLPLLVARLVRAGRGGVSGSVWAVWRWPTALAAGLTAWLVTGWPVSAGITGVTVVGLPMLLSTGRVAAAGIDRVEAVQEWARRLADVLAIGVGLEQAITATVRTCPDAVRAEVAALVARLDARWPTEAAVRAFADDLDDATGDLIAATLILGARRRGPGLSRVLTAVADSVAEEVATRRRVEAERAKPRATARAVTLITLAVVAVGALNGTYLRPYGTPLGQLVLAAIAGGFVAALVWMRSLTLTSPAPRILRKSKGFPGPVVSEGVPR